jgi:MoaA/NifB/PqqE/SkfB family radical SAM enzyme
MNGAWLKALSRLFLPRAGYPSYLLLFVTSRCDASCGHCFYWRHANRHESELTVQEIEALARRLGPMIQITITGGSPDVRSDLAQIALLLARFCRPVNMTLCSNGNRPEELHGHVEAILRGAPMLKLTVDISIDGLKEEHDRIRNLPGLFERALESYRLLAGLKEVYPGLRLGCGLCVSGLNEATAEKTASWAMDHLPLDNFTPVLVRGVPRNPAAADCKPDVFLRIAREVEHRLSSGTFRGYAAFSTLINAKDVVQKKLIAEIHRTGCSPVRCSAGRETAVVYPDGTVAGCELRDEVLGDLRENDMDLHRIFLGERAEHFRQRIRSGRCCCWHQCFLSASIVKSPLLWGHLSRTAWKLRYGRDV